MRLDIVAGAVFPDYALSCGGDLQLKTYAKNSITAGNEHLREARELVTGLKK